MKTYLTLSAIALAATAVLSSTGAVAEEAAAAPVPDIAVTSNVGITSDYRFRGISQNNRSPSIQGGFDVAFNKVGLYLGTWGSNVNAWTAGDGSMEWDLYGGYKTEIAGIAIDLGAIAYTYPGTTKSYKSNTQEAYLGFGYGPAAFKVSYVLGKNYFASTSDTAAKKDASGTIYYDLTLSQELAPKLVASVHAGYTDYKDKNVTAYVTNKFSYADYNVGLAYDLNGYVFGAKYFWNDTKKGTESWATSAVDGTKLYKSGVAVSLTKAF